MANQLISGKTSSSSTAATLLSLVIISVYSLSLYCNNGANSAMPFSSSSYSSSIREASNNTTTITGYILIVIIMIGITGLLIVAARATLVTWITVLVLLALVAGKRRKSLVREGRKITTDITVYAMKNILLRDKSIIAITLGILSFIVFILRRV
ncbi:uncharacterized protein LOC113341999 [Papaver somniferum]|uniref:uncharacterized protein LOC113341999 n=1 Tax=Papaver somniferum TaxID=3469 RepID=UPI000E6F48CA|nr:uncharacterized protein LOC113341999 [Papaver somniferum]